MKYIRTKDGRITNRIDDTYITYIIAQADTIEELCDEFVATDYGINKKPMIIIANNGLNTIKEMLNDSSVFGAIWTDKGLIYVAKMNEKGELELL